LKERALELRIFDILTDNQKPMSIQEIAKHIPDKPESTIRGRLYDNIGQLFARIAQGIYIALHTDKGSALVIEGNGRDLSVLESASVDCIVTDHPWDDPISNIGGDRKFTNEYSCFKYTLEDFKEKARVLKFGGFLVEVLPAENENNYEYLYQIKRMAAECGLLYYAKVPWKKGSFIANTGRKSKNTEDIMFFTKGKARNLRVDAKKTQSTGIVHYMSGANGMLPAMYDFQPPSRNKRLHQAEKPVELFEAILEAISLPNEIVLDQFAGSGALGEAAINKNRIAILIEHSHENVSNIIKRLNAQPLELQ